jgi:hypothetical protein
MRVLLFAMVAVVATGCATYNVRNEMQADGSYRIEVRGNGPADIDGARSMARERAVALCPKGYDVKGEVPEDDMKPRLQLIAMCKAN